MKHEAQKLESTFSQLAAQSVSKLPPSKAKYYPTAESALLNEDDWTFRLANGMIDYTGDDMVFSSSLLRKGNSMANFLRSGLDLSPSFLVLFFLLDLQIMLIRKNSVVVLSSDSDASDELALENCHQ